MGLNQFMYLLGWLTYYLLNAFLVTALMMLIFRFGVMNDDFKFAEGYGFINIVIIYVVYAISIIGFVLLISNFFNKAKTAAQVPYFITSGCNLYTVSHQLPLLFKVFRRCHQ